jgi:hypothetical protein
VTHQFQQQQLRASKLTNQMTRIDTSWSSQGLSEQQQYLQLLLVLLLLHVMISVCCSAQLQGRAATVTAKLAKAIDHNY